MVELAASTSSFLEMYQRSIFTENILRLCIQYWVPAFSPSQSVRPYTIKCCKYSHLLPTLSTAIHEDICALGSQQVYFNAHLDAICGECRLWCDKHCANDVAYFFASPDSRSLFMWSAKAWLKLVSLLNGIVFQLYRSWSSSSFTISVNIFPESGNNCLLLPSEGVHTGKGWIPYLMVVIKDTGPYFSFIIL